MPNRQLVQRLATASIAVAFLVMGLKFLAWWLTGSVALFSDALESIVNVIAASIAWYAIRVSHTPADEDHPFGHTKAEYFSAVVEGALIIIAAVLIIEEAVQALYRGTSLEANPGLGMGVNVLATIINVMFANLLIRTGRNARSPALVADGKHIMSDVVTSVGVLAGLSLALVTGWLWLDSVMAILVSINILWEGWKVMSGSVNGLMDTSIDNETLEAVRSTIALHATGAIEFHDLKTREAGTARFAEFHLVVPSDMTVLSAHEICDQIEGALKKSMPGINVLIHVEPAHKAKDHGAIVLG
jgi:cation diffusion facilitator family transporter